MHILISPNAFKNSLDAGAAALAIEQGFLESELACSTQCFPIGDGGDGTGKLITQLCKGIFQKEVVHDPFGRQIEASIGIIDAGKTAVIEMAAASGISLLKPDEYNPLYASSFGTGELMGKALDKGVTKILLCLGGSATVDGGCGILQSLGISFLDKKGEEMEGLPFNLLNLGRVEVTKLDIRIIHTEVVILCDVKNSLLGMQGAATVFGPQKGATTQQVLQLEAALQRFRDVTLAHTGIDMATIKHGGTAGGTAAGLAVWLGASLVNGIDAYLRMTRYEEALANAHCVITGEGSLDLQTLEGKGPHGVALLAARYKLPVIAVAGKISAEALPKLNQYFSTIYNINEEHNDSTTVLSATEKNLIKTVKKIGNSLAVSNK